MGAAPCNRGDVLRTVNLSLTFLFDEILLVLRGTRFVKDGTALGTRGLAKFLNETRFVGRLFVSVWNRRNSPKRRLAWYSCSKEQDSWDGHLFHSVRRGCGFSSDKKVYPPLDSRPFYHFPLCPCHFLRCSLNRVDNQRILTRGTHSQIIAPSPSFNVDEPFVYSCLDIQWLQAELLRTDRSEPSMFNFVPFNWTIKYPCWLSRFLSGNF